MSSLLANLTTTMTDQELKSLVASLATAQAQTTRLINDLAVKADARQVRADKEMSRLEKLVESVTNQIGAVDRADGKVAETIFYTSLRKRPQLGSIVFDEVWGNTRPRGNDGPEFDIVLINGSSVVLVEVKRQARVDDFKKLTKQVKDFKTSYPHYANHSIYCALATLRNFAQLGNKSL